EPRCPCGRERGLGLAGRIDRAVGSDVDRPRPSLLLESVLPHHGARGAAVGVAAVRVDVVAIVARLARLDFGVAAPGRRTLAVAGATLGLAIVLSVVTGLAELDDPVAARRGDLVIAGTGSFGRAGRLVPGRRRVEQLLAARRRLGDLVIERRGFVASTACGGERQGEGEGKELAVDRGG